MKTATEKQHCWRMSSGLMDALCVQESLRYQIKVEDGCVKIGPVIGLLLGKQCIYYSHKNMTEFTHALHCYEKTGGLFYAFTPEGIDYEKKQIYGLWFDSDSVWRYGHFPFPDVIFRRGFAANERQVETMRANFCTLVFNEKRRDKWEMHRLLETDAQVRPFLPQTCEVLDANTVLHYLTQYTTVILKPTDLSRGRGIFILRLKKSGAIEITDCLKKNHRTFLLAKKDLNSFLKNGGFFSHAYLVQNRLELATVNGNPFDIRVVMQKTTRGQWQCSGIECRIAGVGHMISNIALGGSALSLHRTLLLAFGPNVCAAHIKREILKVSMAICNCMDKTGELFGEFGLDIAIDKNAHLWFIEANVRPSFKGFKQMDYNNYLYICSRPILYAAHLAGFESDGEKR